MLHHFGIASKAEPQIPSAEVKALAVAKRLATRKARFILGHRQRAAIPSVTDVTLEFRTPPQAPPVVAAPPTPPMAPGEAVAAHSTTPAGHSA